MDPEWLTTNGIPVIDIPTNPLVLSLSKDAHKSSSPWRTILTKAMVRRAHHERTGAKHEWIRCPIVKKDLVRSGALNAVFRT